MAQGQAHLKTEIAEIRRGNVRSEFPLSVTGNGEQAPSHPQR